MEIVIDFYAIAWEVLSVMNVSVVFIVRVDVPMITTLRTILNHHVDGRSSPPDNLRSHDMPLVHTCVEHTQLVLDEHLGNLSEHWKRHNVQLLSILPSGLLSLFAQWFGAKPASEGVLDFILQHKYIGVVALVISSFHQLQDNGLLLRDMEGTLSWFHREMLNRTATRGSWVGRVLAEADSHWLEVVRHSVGASGRTMELSAKNLMKFNASTFPGAAVAALERGRAGPVPVGIYEPSGVSGPLVPAGGPVGQTRLVGGAAPGGVEARGGYHVVRPAGGPQSPGAPGVGNSSQTLGSFYSTSPPRVLGTAGPPGGGGGPPSRSNVASSSYRQPAQVVVSSSSNYPLRDGGTPGGPPQQGAGIIYPSPSQQQNYRSDPRGGGGGDPRGDPNPRSAPRSALDPGPSASEVAYRREQMSSANANNQLGASYSFRLWIKWKNGWKHPLKFPNCFHQVRILEEKASSLVGKRLKLCTKIRIHREGKKPVFGCFHPFCHFPLEAQFVAPRPPRRNTSLREVAGRRRKIISSSPPPAAIARTICTCPRSMGVPDRGSLPPTIRRTFPQNSGRWRRSCENRRPRTPRRWQT